MSIITLLTDFTDVYPAAMKAVILSIAPQATIIDITHRIPPQNIKWGAAVLSITAPYFPDNTVHIAVVDPGVGSRRKAIVIKACGEKTHYFVGPDNGLLLPAARALGSIEVFEVSTQALKPASSTFHGRDVFAPIGAELSLGKDLHSFATPTTHYIEPAIQPPVLQQNTLLAEILFIDSFGNIITNVPGKTALEFIRGSHVLYLKNQKVSFAHTYSEVAVRQPLMLIGSHGFLEIAINQGSAQEYFKLQPEDVIEITKTE